jgi:hypothetical protein
MSQRNRELRPTTTNGAIGRPRPDKLSIARSIGIASRFPKGPLETNIDPHFPFAYRPGKR